jgi:hypothetical protein
LASVPLKPEYGPTLGSLLEPSWRSAGPVVRAIAVIAAVGVVALAVAGVLSLLNATYSHGGRVPFSFDYRGLYRVEPGPGGYVKVERTSGGVLQDSYAVAPLRLDPYRGSVTGELPLVAARYTHALAERFPAFTLEGEGKTRINSTLAGYDVLYRARVEGRAVSGRDVLLLPERAGARGAGAREGVAIEMLSTQPASVAKPVGSSGVLETPLKTFTFG